MPFIAPPDALNMPDHSADSLSRWWLWGSAMLAGIAAAWGLQDGLGYLLPRWRTDYSHGWLIVPMSAWLLQRSLRNHDIGRLRPSPMGVLLLALTLSAYILCRALDTALGTMATIPLVALGTVAAMFGARAARIAMPAAVILYFSIPVWDLLIPPLQTLSIFTVKAALAAFGPPTHVVGNLISIPSGTFEVVEGCSGARYLTISLALAAFYGFIWYERWSTRLTLLTVAAAAAMLANWTRIYLLVLVGDATDMQHYLVAVSHEAYSWFVYAASLIPVLWLAGHLEPTNGVRAPFGDRALELEAKPQHLLGTIALVCLLLSSPAFLARPESAAERGTVETILTANPTGWNRTTTPRSWQPEFRNPGVVVIDAFENAYSGQGIDVFVASYWKRTTESRLFDPGNSLHAGWQLLTSEIRLVDTGIASYRVIEQQILNGSEHRVLWSWYVIGGQITHSRLAARLLQSVGLIHGRQDAAIVAVSSRCLTDCSKAVLGMQSFVQAVHPQLLTAADGSSGTRVHDRPSTATHSP